MGFLVWLSPDINSSISRVFLPRQCAEPRPRLILPLKRGATTAVIGPHGAGLVNIMYCEQGTPLFFFTTYDTASPEHTGPDAQARKTSKVVQQALKTPGG